METMQAIAVRKSCRDYSNQEVEEAKLKQVLQAVNYAPGTSAFHVTVIRNREILQLIDDDTLETMKNGNDFTKKMAAQPGYRPLYNAPILIVFSIPDPMIEASAASAITTMTIAATDLGLGSCFIRSPIRSLASDKQLSTCLNLPEGYSASVGMLLGYCASEKFRQQRLVPTISYLD
nr:nitroreductase family protein [Sedimentibacter sp.]